MTAVDDARARLAEAIGRSLFEEEWRGQDWTWEQESADEAKRRYWLTQGSVAIWAALARPEDFAAVAPPVPPSSD